MAAYAGGTRVKGGYYIHGKTFEFATVYADGGSLPGSGDSRWLRVPTPVVVAIAPALGALFVVALPFVGIGFVVYELATRIGLRLAGRPRAGGAGTGAGAPTAI